MTIEFPNKATLPQTGEAYLELLRSGDGSIIRSAADFDSLIALRLPLLSKVAQSKLEEFRDALIFKNDGLAHADYAVLKDPLSHAEIVELFGYFGLSEKLFKDWQDKACAGQGTCSPSYGSVCTSNC